MRSADAPVSPHAEACNRAAHRAYRLCLIGLVPIVGLVLGPLSAWKGARASREAKDDPGFTASPLARAALILGALTAITQWGGLVVMILGLLWS
jgi:hypothetical protein